MSKSLGNSPEPLDLISKNGADAVRVGMLLCSPAGNDLLYDDALIEQGRNFCNKLWNAMRLVKGWPVDESIAQTDVNKISVEWFDSSFNAALQNINALYDDYRLSEALMATYKLVWDDFCSWFLEMIKPAYQQPIDRPTYEAVTGYFEKLLKVLHPFMPFITEEIWQILEERNPGESIMLSSQPVVGKFNQELLDKFTFAEEVIMAIRNVRKEKNIPQKDAIRLFIRKNNNETSDTTFDNLVGKLCNVSELAYVEEKTDGCLSFVVGSTEFFIPLSGTIDVAEELKKLEAEHAYTTGFLAKVMQKLGNESFVKNAPPAVIDAERKKQEDADARIRVLEEQIKSLR
jgi:valyl-tRNA synthetase